ncbi:MAG: hypothetical protein MR927_03300 [Campylobacter sp.]|nr:hypothetical protein [Campylobacter sp.]
MILFLEGDFAYLYDESGRSSVNIPLTGGTLQGYTSNSVSIKRGSFIYIHDKKGKNIKTISA